MQPLNPVFLNMFNEMNKLSGISMDSFSLIEELIISETLEPLQFYSLPNERCRKMSFVKKGVLRIYHTDEQGNEWNKHFFVENNFLASSPDPKITNNTTIQALSPVQILSVPIQNFINMTETHMPFTIFTQKLLSAVLEREK